MTGPTEPCVRPTKRCLDQIGLSFPDLATPLCRLSHDLVRRAQAVPNEVKAGGAERIRSLTDRVWLKCKTSTLRGAVTCLSRPECEEREIPCGVGEWWLGAAGHRQEGSPGDFYAQLKSEADRAGRGTGKASSEHLLPATIDIERLQAELATRSVEAIRGVVTELIVQSLCHSKPYSAEFKAHRVTAYVRAANGSEAYLAIVAEGNWNEKLLAVILSAVPGVPPDSWLAEPGGVAEIQPRDGQIIWSTIIPPEVQARLLDKLDG